MFSRVLKMAEKERFELYMIPYATRDCARGDRIVTEIVVIFGQFERDLLRSSAAAVSFFSRN